MSVDICQRCNRPIDDNGHHRFDNGEVVCMVGAAEERRRLEEYVLRYRSALQAIERWGFHKFAPGDASEGWENQCSHVMPDRMRHCGYPPEAHPTGYEIAVYAQKMLDDGRS